MHARKRSINVVSSSFFYMFIKKEENLRLTVYKIEIVHAQLRAGYCTRWAPKVILDARFFSEPDGHVSSNYEPDFLGHGANFWRPGISGLATNSALTALTYLMLVV